MAGNMLGKRLERRIWDSLVERTHLNLQNEWTTWGNMYNILYIYIYKEGQELKILRCLESTDGREKGESEPTGERMVSY